MKNDGLQLVGSWLQPGKNRPAGLLLLCALAATFLILAETRSNAEGFRNPPPGAFNLGRAGGRIAQVDDSSAVAQNPANLVDLTAPEFQFTPSIVYIKVDYDSPAGESASTEEPWKLLPNMFASMPIYEDRLAVGFGITTPYGLANEWDKKSEAFTNPAGWRYQTPYFAQLMAINFTPAVSIKAGEHLSLGAGLDVMWSQLKLKQFYPWFLAVGPGAPDGHLKAEADGIGAGANFGSTIHITPRQRFALTLRTPIRVDYSGSIEVDNVPAPLPGGSTMRGDLKTDIKFPLIIAGGYGIELTDKIRIEADAEWLQFSNFRELPLESATATALGLPAAIPQNWNDTFTVGIAGDWQFASRWTFRAGYRFYESPVPDSTFSPTIPDANQNVFTFGLAYHGERHSLEGAYGLDFYGDRHIRNNLNPAFNGTYSMTVHLFSAAYRYSF
jgi:long-chain fatty acid transport protein